MNIPPIVSPQEWEAARQELLAKEKELTRARDAIAAQRRQMPSMAVDKDYRLLDSITSHFDRTDSVGEWRQETHSIQAAVRDDSAGLARAATELAAAPDGRIRPFEGDTSIFITPGHRFRAVDGLLTNFHLPRSTLFMLVSALMGRDRMRAAYAHAIATGYRFYSYGDASLLLPARV